MSEAPVGSKVNIHASNIEEIVLVAIREWAAEYPEEVRIFREQMVFERGQLINERGMSANGTRKKIMEVPVKLAGKIQRMTHKDWMRDSKVLNTLHSQFKMGHVANVTGRIQSQ